MKFFEFASYHGDLLWRSICEKGENVLPPAMGASFPPTMEAAMQRRRHEDPEWTSFSILAAVVEHVATTVERPPVMRQKE